MVNRLGKSPRKKRNKQEPGGPLLNSVHEPIKKTESDPFLLVGVASRSFLCRSWIFRFRIFSKSYWTDCYIRLYFNLWNRYLNIALWINSNKHQRRLSLRWLRMKRALGPQGKLEPDCCAIAWYTGLGSMAHTCSCVFILLSRVRCTEQALSKKPTFWQPY